MVDKLSKKTIFQLLRGDMKRIKILPILMIIFIVFSVILLISEWAFNPVKNIKTANAAEYQNSVTYLPITTNKYPLSNLYGVEITRYRMAEGLPEIEETNLAWVRYNRLLWSSVEEVEGNRDWTTLWDMEQNLINAYNNGLKVIMIVRSTPTWAQKIPGVFCGPIKPDKLAAFGDFMYEAVSRYSKPPYNVKYWEIWNEPDVIYTGDNATDVWGCWGDSNDPYYGGGYYAEMLKHVYPKIKAADPSAKVVLGGLLLDCDPRPTSNWCASENHDERPPKFLEGVLLNGGGNYFDGVSFHGYDHFYFTDPQLGEYDNPNWGSAWDGTLRDGTKTNRIGAVSSYKAEYLKGLLTKFNMAGKFLMNTEAAMLCGKTGEPPPPGCEPDDESLYEQTKARYLTKAYTSAAKDDLLANIWFSLFGWRNSDLLNDDLSPRPAYLALDIASEMLGGATFIKKVNNYTGVQIYEFEMNRNKIWVLWSLNGTPLKINLPSTPDAVKDHLGVDKSPTSTFTATIDPHFLIWYP